MHTDDAERLGRPNVAVIPENIEKTLKIIMGNRKVKLQKMADALKLSKGSIYSIIHKHLGMKKLFSKWVPRLLTPKQKQQREDDSKNCWEMYTRKKKKILRRSCPQRLLALCRTLKKMLSGKRFGLDEEVIIETEAYFEGLDKLFYTRGIEKMKKGYNDCNVLKGDYIDE
nr:uncharacterized protein LOC121116227 [Lepeophtheirus salmonis]